MLEPIKVLGIECRRITSTRAGIVAREWVGETDVVRVVVVELNQDRGWSVELDVHPPEGEGWSTLLAGYGETLAGAEGAALEMHGRIFHALAAVERAMDAGSTVVSIEAHGLHVMVQRSGVDGVPMVDIDTLEDGDDDEPRLRIFVNDNVLHEHPALADVIADRDAEDVSGNTGGSAAISPDQEA